MAGATRPSYWGCWRSLFDCLNSHFVKRKSALYGIAIRESGGFLSRAVTLAARF